MCSHSALAVKRAVCERARDEGSPDAFRQLFTSHVYTHYILQDENLLCSEISNNLFRKHHKLYLVLFSYLSEISLNQNQ